MANLPVAGFYATGRSNNARPENTLRQNARITLVSPMEKTDSRSRMPVEPKNHMVTPKCRRNRWTIGLLPRRHRRRGRCFFGPETEIRAAERRPDQYFFGTKV
jgi:hypothetical protein